MVTIAVMFDRIVLTVLLHKSFQVDFHEYCLSAFRQAPNLRDIKVSRGPQPVSPPDNNTITKRWGDLVHSQVGEIRKTCPFRCLSEL